MTIKSITGEGGATVCVTVCGDGNGEKERFFISKKLWQSGVYSAGDSVTEETYDRLKTTSERTSALREASRAIGYGEKSVRELERKLRGKNLPEDAVKWAIAVLRKNGYIDEDSACARIAESAVSSKHYGRRRVLDYLLSHGYDRASAESAVNAIPEESYRAALMYNIEHKFPAIAEFDIQDRQKAVASLVRLGFTPSEIMDAVKERTRLS